MRNGWTALLLLGSLLWAMPAWATTYYLSAGGHGDTPTDSNSCAQAQTITTPKATMNSLIVNCIAAGDTVYIRGGTYDQRMDFDTPNKPGTVGSPITIAGYNGENPVWKYTDPTVDDYGGIRLWGSGHSLGWYVFKDFILDGANYNATNANTGTGWQIRGGNHDIIIDNLEIRNQNYNGFFTQSATNITIRNSRIHDARATNTPGKRFQGLYISDHSTNILVEHCDIYNNGAGGQVQPGPATGVIIRNNKIHHNNNTLTTQTVGGLTVASNSGVISGVTIANNLIYKNGNPSSPAGGGIGWGIAITGGAFSLNATKIYNNTIAYAQGPLAGYAWGLTLNGSPLPTNTDIRNNIFWSNGDGGATGLTAPGTIFTNNTANTTDPSFVNGPAFDFTLQSSSVAINGGVALPGMPFNVYSGKTKPDIGAFETFRCNASATVNANSLDTTCAMNLNTPVLPATGITGMVAKVGGVARGTTTSAKLIGTDSVVRTTFDGAACAGGQTWTTDYTPGNLTDSALIGGPGGANQRAFASTALAVTNGCGSVSGPTFTTVASSNFTGSAENPLSETGAWLYVPSVGSKLQRGASNSVIPDPAALTGDQGAAYVGAAFGDDQFSRADLTTVGSGGQGAGTGLCVRCSTANKTQYRFVIDRPVTGSGLAELGRFIGSTYTVLETWSQAYANGDTFTLAVAGETVYVYDKTLALVKTHVDTGGGLASGGTPGLAYSSTESAGTLADNWVGGNFATTSAPPPIVGTLEQKTHQFTQSQTPGGAIGAVGAANTDIRRGTAFALLTQLDCTVSACDPVGLRLYYRRNGGAYQPVPDVMGPDQISYFGTTTDPSYLAGAVTCCLTGALTANTGTTQFTAAAVPIITLAQNASILERQQLLLGALAAVNDPYEFIEYVQTNQALPATPAGGAKITVNPAATIAAPTSLQAVGASSNTLIDLIWAPVVDVALSGYNIYQCAATPCTIAIGVRVGQNRPASSSATFSSITEWRTVVLASATYYFVVTAFDSGGQESVVSNEVAVVRTGLAARAPSVP